MKNTVTQQQVEDQIIEVKVETIFDKVTVVAVRLRNGFVLVESAGAVDKANYDVTVGTEICLQRIKDQIWKLEGYQLATALASPRSGILKQLADEAGSVCALIERAGANRELTLASVAAADHAANCRRLVGFAVTT